jgi:hypothetical protein
MVFSHFCWFRFDSMCARCEASLGPRKFALVAARSLWNRGLLGHTPDQVVDVNNRYGPFNLQASGMHHARTATLKRPQMHVCALTHSPQPTTPQADNIWSPSLTRPRGPWQQRRDSTSPFSNRGNPALNSFATSLQRDNMSNSSILNAYVRLYRSTRFVQAAQHHYSHALTVSRTIPTYSVHCAVHAGQQHHLSMLTLCHRTSARCASSLNGIGLVFLVGEWLRCTESLPRSTQCGRSCVCGESPLPHQPHYVSGQLLL